MATHGFDRADAKNVLQTHFARQRLGEPVYITRSFTIASNIPHFQSSIKVEDETFYSLETHTKKVDAEKDAAYQACVYLVEKKKLLVPEKFIGYHLKDEMFSNSPLLTMSAKNALEHYAMARKVAKPVYKSILESTTGMWRTWVEVECAKTGEVLSHVTDNPDPCKVTSERLAVMGLFEELLRKDPDYELPKVFMK